MRHFLKESLGLFPTPLHRLPNISRELRTNVWIKRDDLCGVALGGNKVRKLEYLLAEAKNQGYNLVMTTGQAQSNHAMLTAACAMRMGLDCVLVLKKRGVTACKGNQVLNHLMGVQVRYVDTDSYEEIYEEMLKKILENQKTKENLDISMEEAQDTARKIALAAIKYGDLPTRQARITSLTSKDLLLSKETQVHISCIPLFVSNPSLENTKQQANQ